jgi:hypothetical protein
MRQHSLTPRELMGEIAACCALLIFLFTLLIVGSALRPYEPSMHSEATYQEEN